MAAIADEARNTLSAPVLRVSTDDNLCSMVEIRGSLDEVFPNGIIENSRWFLITISPACRKRYYDEGDEVTAAMVTKSFKIPQTFRRVTGSPAKVIESVKKYLDKIS